jgi:hypothetical protein
MKFGISNLDALGCFPFLRALKQTRTRSSGCMDEVTVLTKLHHRELSKVLKKLERQLNGFKYSNFDFHTLHSERINHPSEYGMFISTRQFKIPSLCLSNNKSILTVRFRV